jgi:hypothetical protein
MNIPSHDLSIIGQGSCLAGKYLRSLNEHNVEEWADYLIFQIKNGEENAAHGAAMILGLAISNIVQNQKDAGYLFQFGDQIEVVEEEFEQKEDDSSEILDELAIPDELLLKKDDGCEIRPDLTIVDAALLKVMSDDEIRDKCYEAILYRIGIAQDSQFRLILAELIIDGFDTFGISQVEDVYQQISIYGETEKDTAVLDVYDEIINSLSQLLRTLDQQKKEEEPKE